jgi:putative membrane protein
MQLGLILGIVFAIGAAMFAMQNNTPVTVTVAVWTFEGSLALVLLVAMGLGALIAGLVSSPAMIRRQWNVARLGRQVAELEHKLNEEARHNDALRAELSQARGVAVVPEGEVKAEEKPYVGLRTLIAGGGEEKPPTP